jgi:hypothetical protein
VFAAIAMDLPARNVRLLAHAGHVEFGGDEYLPEDPVIGVFSAIEDMTDGIGSEAPSIMLTFMPPTDAAAADLSSPALQGSPVRIYLGAVDPTTGAVIDVVKLRDGLLDVPTIKLNRQGRTVDYEVTSVFEDFMVADDGANLSDGFHQYLWPGELGCVFLTYVAHQLYWGQEAPDGVTL